MQEKEWRREYIALWISRLEADDLTPVDRLHDAWAGEALPALIEMSGQGDSYAKLWYANAIWQIANGASIDMTSRWKARKTANDLWESLQVESVELYVFNYAAQQLKSAQSQRSVLLSAR